MSKKVIGRDVTPPKGWKFEAGYLIPAEYVTETTFNALYEWAKSRKYGLTPSQRHLWHQNGFSLACYYTVETQAWEKTLEYLGDGAWTPRKDTKRRVSIGQQEVIIGGVSYWNYCANCQLGGLATWHTRGNRLCAFCSTPCASDGCSERISKINPIKGADADKCLKCVPRKRCRWCATWFPESDLEEITGGYHACKNCADDRRCQECKKVTGSLVTHNRKKVCNECYASALEKERKPLEKWDAEELPVGNSLRLETLSNRPVRVISIETEVDGDPNALARTLYNEGIVREPIVENYGTRCPDNSSWPAFLKYDGSVTGGELINFLLQLDDDKHAESLLNVLAKLRSLKHLKKVEYNANCGGHIHIDAHNFSSDNVWRLLTGYNYLEDVIFRLAGAGHKYGHRTLVPGHDRANHGRGYSHPTAKGPWGVKSGAYRAAANQDRMTGLNFQPYLGAVSYCSCGAGVENLRACKCVLPRCTIEWRVWNSQGNPRILHGWIAFMQSLHAWADSAREMTNDEEKEYPPLAWTKLAWKDTSQGHKNIALERVKWIFGNLVFTDAERDSLIYAFKQTDIEFPDGFWNEIQDIPAPKNRTVKAPRNCTIRQVPIEIVKPDRKVTSSRKAAYAAANRRANARLRDFVAPNPFR